MGSGFIDRSDRRALAYPYRRWLFLCLCLSELPYSYSYSYPPRVFLSLFLFRGQDRQPIPIADDRSHHVSHHQWDRCYSYSIVLQLFYSYSYFHATISFLSLFRGPIAIPISINYCNTIAILFAVCGAMCGRSTETVFFIAKFQDLYYIVSMHGVQFLGPKGN